MKFLIVVLVVVIFFGTSLYIAFAIGISMNVIHTWEIQGIKAKGPGTIVMLEENWEPFGYDREANVVYVRRKVVED